MDSPESPIPQYDLLEELPDYIVPFDSDHPIPDIEEQLIASATLREAITDKLLATIHVLTNKSKNAGVASEVALDSTDLNGKPVEIVITSMDTTAHPDLHPYYVSLKEGPRELDGTFRRRHDYSVPDLHSDEGVTRRDIRQGQIPKMARSKHPKIGTPFSNKAAGFEKLVQIFQDIEQRQKQEKDLGLNDQPIGAKEARTIALIISRGRIQTPIQKTIK